MASVSVSVYLWLQCGKIKSFFALLFAGSTGPLLRNQRNTVKDNFLATATAKSHDNTEGNDSWMVIGERSPPVPPGYANVHF